MQASAVLSHDFYLLWKYRPMQQTKKRREIILVRYYYFKLFSVGLVSKWSVSVHLKKPTTTTKQRAQIWGSSDLEVRKHILLPPRQPTNESRNNCIHRKTIFSCQKFITPVLPQMNSRLSLPHKTFNLLKITYSQYNHKIQNQKPVSKWKHVLIIVDWQLLRSLGNFLFFYGSWVDWSLNRTVQTSN